MFHSVKSYFRFLGKSTNQYGVHSPFVYDYLTKGLKEKISKSDKTSLDQFRNTLRSDNRLIHVKDFGAGSRVFKGPERIVKDIAKNAGVSKRRSRLLYQTVKHFKPVSILEIGTSLGLATAPMALAAPQARIDTLEGCPETTKIAQSMFDRFGLKSIKLHVGEFETTLPKLLEENSYDIIFFDGNHQKEATLRYFDMCLGTSKENSVFIFDDIHWSPQMEEAWKEICGNEKVTLSIDTYQWGLVFFHSGREKEHFVLRL